MSPYCHICQSTGCRHAQEDYDVFVREVFAKPELLRSWEEVKDELKRAEMYCSKTCVFEQNPQGKGWEEHHCGGTHFQCGRCGHKGMSKELITGCVAWELTCSYCNFHLTDLCLMEELPKLPPMAMIWALPPFVRETFAQLAYNLRRAPKRMQFLYGMEELP